MPPGYLQRLLADAPAARFASWDQHRSAWLQRADRVLVLHGPGPNLGGVADDTLAAWRGAVTRLVAIEDRDVCRISGYATAFVAGSGLAEGITASVH